MENTAEQYYQVIEKCRTVFTKKMHDYGSAWRILRTPSLTDQIFIKANRIRTIQETGVAKIDEGMDNEFLGMVNYCVMALIQLENGDNGDLDMPLDEASALYDKHVKDTFELMQNKNHDYGEAWRDMRVSSLTDLILMKILRIKQIEDNQGETLISEGIDANYQDILNYSVFALIKLYN